MNIMNDGKFFQLHKEAKRYNLQAKYYFHHHKQMVKIIFSIMKIMNKRKTNSLNKQKMSNISNVISIVTNRLKFSFHHHKEVEKQNLSNITNEPKKQKNHFRHNRQDKNSFCTWL